MKITVEVKGTKELQRTLEKLGERAQAELGKALYAEAELIMTESKKQVPVDTGTLQGTGHVEQPEYDHDQVIVQMGYGGPAAPYAVVQHERLDFKHKVGKAKYLEDPVKAAVPKLPSAIAKRLEKVVSKGG